MQRPDRRDHLLALLFFLALILAKQLLDIDGRPKLHRLMMNGRCRIRFEVLHQLGQASLSRGRTRVVFGGDADGNRGKCCPAWVPGIDARPRILRPYVRP